MDRAILGLEMEVHLKQVECDRLLKKCTQVWLSYLPYIKLTFSASKLDGAVLLTLFFFSWFCNIGAGLAKYLAIVSFRLLLSVLHPTKLKVFCRFPRTL
jgi:hypothetical protein